MDDPIFIKNDFANYDPLYTSMVHVHKTLQNKGFENNSAKENVRILINQHFLVESFNVK